MIYFETKVVWRNAGKSKCSKDTRNIDFWSNNIRQNDIKFDNIGPIDDHQNNTHHNKI
jgi:hypothetical protein